MQTVPLSLVGARGPRPAPRRPRRPPGFEALEDRLPPGSLFSLLLGGTAFAIGAENLEGTALTAGLETEGNGNKGVSDLARPEDDSLIPVGRTVARYGGGAGPPPDRLRSPCDLRTLPSIAGSRYTPRRTTFGVGGS